MIMLCPECKKQVMIKRTRHMEIGFSTYDVSYRYCSCGYDNKEYIHRLVDQHDELTVEIDRIETDDDGVWISGLEGLVSEQVSILRQIERIGKISKQ